MKLKKKSSAVAVLLLASALLGGCSTQDSTNPAYSMMPTATETTLHVHELADTDPLVAINGQAVNWADVKHVYHTIDHFFAQTGEQVSDADLRAMAMETVLEQRVMDHKAAEWSLLLSEEERSAITAAAKSEWEEIVTEQMSLFFNIQENSSESDKKLARDAVIQMLSEAGFSEADYISEALNAAQNERVEKKLYEGVTVSAAELQAGYQKRVAADAVLYENDVYQYEMDTSIYGGTSWYTPAGYRNISWILLYVDDEALNRYHEMAAGLEEHIELTESGENALTTPAVTQEELDAASKQLVALVQPVVDEIYAKTAEGVPFAELVRTYGKDTAWMSGDAVETGRPVSQDSVIWDPAIIRAAYSVQNIGEISEPVVGNAGVYLVCYLSDQASGGIEMTDDMRNGLMDTLLLEKESELLTESMNTWLAEANIMYTEAGKNWLEGE